MKTIKYLALCAVFLLPISTVAQNVEEQAAIDKQAVEKIKDGSRSDVKKVIEENIDNQQREDRASEYKSDEIRYLVKNFKKPHIGFAGGPVFRMPIMNMMDMGNDPYIGFMPGARGGVLIAHSMLIGGAMYGMATRLSNENLTGNYSLKYQRLFLAYGGGLFEYILFPRSIVNFSVGLLVGGGTLRNRYNDTTSDNYRYCAFFILEPELNIYLNLATFVKFGIGASYREVQGLNLSRVYDNNLRGVSVSLMVLFGRF